MTDAHLTERIEQLRGGTVGAAAALDEAHASLGTEAVALADRLHARADAGASEERLAAALEALEEVHFDLLRIKIHGEEPEETSLEADMDRLREHLRELGADDV